MRARLLIAATLLGTALVLAQVPPSPGEIANYQGVQAAVPGADGEGLERVLRSPKDGGSLLAAGE